MKQKDFTLVELLVVITIIAILAAMLLPALNKARGKAQGIKCVSNLKQLYLSQMEYMDSFNGYLPAGSIVLDDDTVSGITLLRRAGMIKNELAVCCPVTAAHPDVIKIAKKTSDSICRVMYSTVTYQYGKDDNNQSYESIGYIVNTAYKTLKNGTSSAVFPNLSRYRKPGSRILNVDANAKFSFASGVPNLFIGNSAISGSLCNKSWSGFASAGDATVFPYGPHLNQTSIGCADGSAGNLELKRLSDYRVYFYRNFANIPCKL